MERDTGDTMTQSIDGLGQWGSNDSVNRWIELLGPITKSIDGLGLWGPNDSVNRWNVIIETQCLSKSMDWVNGDPMTKSIDGM
jgi:hypothetical protein